MTLTLNAVIQFFSQDTPAYDAVLPNQDWMQTHQQFRRDNRNSHILITYALAMTLTLRMATTTKILHDTLAHDAALPYQIW